MQIASRILTHIHRQLRPTVVSALFFAPLMLAAFVLTPALAQDAPQTAGASVQPSTPVVPQQVRYTGKLAGRPAETLDAIFRIYAAPEGGEPLWTETQQLTTAEDGSYSVLLGGFSPSGLPQGVFAGGAARWLGISIDGYPEQERAILSSVPYAMKSADAESLSGHAASDFVTQAQLAQFAQTNQAGQSTRLAAISPEVSPPGAVTGSGTANTIPLWTGALTQGNSEIYQVGSDIGINETAPTATLDVNGTENVRGVLSFPALATATATTGQRSQLLQLSASAWSSTSKTPVTPTFKLLTNFVNNNTSTAGGHLEFHYQNGSNSANVLTIAGNGVISFAPTQTFPGTIKSVTATSPITATTTSGAVSLGLDTTSLETTLNPVYAQLATGNTFNGEVQAGQLKGAGYPALNGAGLNGSIGVDGSSDTGLGVVGTTTSGTGVYGSSSGTGSAGYFINNSTANPAIWVENDAVGSPHLSIGVKAYAPNSTSIGVLGKSMGPNSWGVYGENIGGTDSYGVYASTTGTGSTAVYGISSGGADTNGFPGSGVVGISTSGNGVQGGTQGASATGATVAVNGVWGVWGDIGNTGGTGGGGAILGTADNYYAAFLRNNGDFATLVADNGGNGQAAAFNGYSTSQSGATVTVVNSSSGGAGEMDNTSDSAVTLYLSNNGTGGVTDTVVKTNGPANGGLFKTLMASTPAGTCGFGGNGDLSCTGQVKSLVSTGGGARKVETYATQSPENWIEDYGTGSMERGVALVKIDPAFAETISESADYHVFLTPNADANALYVINRTAAGFEVRESKGGTSSLTFDYKIVAKRRGYEAQRLTDVTETFNAAKAIAELSRKRRPASLIKPIRSNVSAQPTELSKAVEAALEAPEPRHSPAPRAKTTAAPATPSPIN